MSVAASAVTAGSGASVGATRIKASSSSVTSRGGADPAADRHQSTDEEDRDYLDLSGDNDRDLDLDLDEHPDQVSSLSRPPHPLSL